MAQRIISVIPGSPAAKAGIRPGDDLLSIGKQPVKDFLDYQDFTANRRL